MWRRKIFKKSAKCQMNTARKSVTKFRVKVNLCLQGEAEKTVAFMYPPNGGPYTKDKRPVGVFIQHALKKLAVQFVLTNNFRARLIPGDGRENGVSRFLNNNKDIDTQDVCDGDTIEITYKGEIKRGKVVGDQSELYRVSDKSLDIEERDIQRSRKRLGNGSFGYVYEGTYRNRNVALKELRSFQLSNWSDVKNLMREIEIMTTIKHPAVMPLLGVIQATKAGDRPTLVMPRMYATLDGIITKKDPKWDYTQKYIAVYGTALGMSALADSGVIHRDLKLANVLLDDHLYPVITDFGFSKAIDSVGKSVSHSMACGTETYMAPEILMGSQSYSNKVDVFAFGMLMYCVMCDKPKPYQNKADYAVPEYVMNGGRPDVDSERISDTLKDIIKASWSQVSGDRPTFKQIVDALETKAALEDVNMERFNGYKQYIARAEKVLIGEESESSSEHISEGKKYENGEGCEVDLTAAAECYRKAAAEGFADGFFHLARCYQHGLGVTKDIVAAAVLMEKAKSLGCTLE